ncbi:hypothetical protein BD410DRAFT_806357 [Rickenella mellea]|uniref:Uncharacterized protein n=1 Tax=Rickenella mellea TaxID=50990 RepID=A0A4Y7PTA6_9AGAM|nr:hypothetical protein BD410DRAFT_806357 [Rickenella mellea]
MSDSSPDIAGLIADASQLQFLNCVTVSGTGKSCRAMDINQNIWFIIPQFAVYDPWSEIAFGRHFNFENIYAIYQKSKFILIILGLPCVAALALSVYTSFLEKPAVDSIIIGTICDEHAPSFDLRIHKFEPTVQLAGNILSLIIDILVFTLTFAKTIHHAIGMRKVGLGNSLGYFMLRDVLGFSTKLLIGVVGTVVFFGAIGNWLVVLAAISNPLTIILINRLVLSLRQVSHIRGNVPTLGAIGTIQEPAFATNPVLGNLGAPLRLGIEEDYDDDEVEEISVDDEAEVVGEREIVNHTEIIEELRNPSDV